MVMTEPLVDWAGMRRLNRFSASCFLENISQTHFGLKNNLKISPPPPPPHIGSPAETQRGQKHWIFQIYFLWCVRRLLPTNSNSTIRGGGETTGGGSLYRHHTGTQQSKGSDVTGGSGVGCNNPHQTLLTEVSQKAERCSLFDLSLPLLLSLSLFQTCTDMSRLVSRETPAHGGKALCLLNCRTDLFV